jgi:hypothetical protein
MKKSDQLRVQLATKAAGDAIQERERGDSKLSQEHFLKALKYGASKSDLLIDLRQWLFHENVRSEVSAAAGSGDLFKVETGISLAVNCKYPDSPHLDSLIALRKPLLQRSVLDLVSARDGGALDQHSSTIFLDRIEQLGVESTGDLSLLTEGDFVGIPPIRVRRVLPLLLKMGESTASKSKIAYSRFMTVCPVTTEVVERAWKRSKSSKPFSQKMNERKEAETKEYRQDEDEDEDEDDE